MATYIYSCPEHGVFEHTQPMTASLPDVRKCPKCGEKSPRKLTPPAVFVEGGTGAGKDWRPPKEGS